MRSPEIQKVEARYLKKDLPDFRPGDTVRVTFRLSPEEVASGQEDQKKGVTKTRQPIASFEGIVIRKRGEGTSSTFTVRRVSHGVGIERIFFLHSPSLVRIEVLRRGRVRRARLYYLKGLSAREARIKEDRRRAAADRAAAKKAKS
ncbi:MAG: 50S ribosomal protein L19 [Armatimonadetes bacterium]|nr:50S ribosomal protein L19 [Armatimonadota bacterium]MDW8121991.1 50S ribosomal protein L19 [Armatimonadota bacterium]